MSVQNSPSATQTLTNAFNGPDNVHCCSSAFLSGILALAIKDTPKWPLSCDVEYMHMYGLEGIMAAELVFIKSCKSIALAIVALISAPFILIEIFFRALISAFVLMGDAIKSSINGTMEQFKQESKALGKSLSISAGAFPTVFYLIASPFIGIPGTSKK